MMKTRVSMLLKSRASSDMLSFSLCNNSAHEETPLYKDTIDSVLRHREVSRAKDLPAPPRNGVSRYEFDNPDFTAARGKRRK